MDSKGKFSFVLKPNIKNALIPKLINSIIFAAIIGFVYYFLIGYYLLVEQLKLSIAAYWTIFLVFLVLTIGISPFIFYMNLRNREYRFYSDRVEYFEGWMNISRQTTPYSKVTDITMTKSIWDRFFNTGTIGLLTAGSHFTSVSIPYVNEPEKVYDYLQKEVLRIK